MNNLEQANKVTCEQCESVIWLNEAEPVATLSNMNLILYHCHSCIRSNWISDLVAMEEIRSRPYCWGCSSLVVDRKKKVYWKGEEIFCSSCKEKDVNWDGCASCGSLTCSCESFVCVGHRMEGELESLHVRACRLLNDYFCTCFFVIRTQQ